MEDDVFSTLEDFQEDTAVLLTDRNSFNCLKMVSLCLGMVSIDLK